MAPSHFFRLKYGLIALVALFTFQVTNALSATILIVTDQRSQKKAHEIEAALKNTPPFSMLENFNVIIQPIDRNMLHCHTVEIANS